MKLRNKKTGNVWNVWSFYDGNLAINLKYFNNDEVVNLEYSSLAKLNEDWEDYEPAEPLIEDEKARKVFREWAELFGAELFQVTHLFCSKRHTTIVRSIDLTTEPSIELPGHIGEDSEIYNKEELGGEEEE